MKAVVVREHGGLEALRFEELPDPSPGPGEVVVEVRAVGLNHLDLWVRRGVPGHAFPLPLVPGSDVSGRVSSVGDGVRHLAAGDEVVLAPATSCGTCGACLAGEEEKCPDYRILGEGRDGGCADKVVVPRANVFPKPKGLSFEEAASFPLAFLTAWHMLAQRAALRPGETVLVHAAGSGVGAAAVSIAKHLGATVIATAGSEAKAARALDLGADRAVDYSKEDFARAVREFTGKKGADVVVEHVGAATWEGSMRSLARHGRLVTCGATSGHEVGLNLRHLFFKSQSILGSTMGNFGEFREIVRLFDEEKLRPVVDRVLPLAEIREAHRLLEARAVFGKIVLVP
ncbi:MAG: alcohol dehydrogenase [Candidatus Latescibacterota bacterium]|nr:MAG: alcohol dehydrogenase [Candidatus Latescibacterota bacterium]